MSREARDWGKAVRRWDRLIREARRQARLHGELLKAEPDAILPAYLYLGIIPYLRRCRRAAAEIVRIAAEGAEKEPR